MAFLSLSFYICMSVRRLRGGRSAQLGEHTWLTACCAATLQWSVKGTGLYRPAARTCCPLAPGSLYYLSVCLSSRSFFHFSRHHRP